MNSRSLGRFQTAVVVALLLFSSGAIAAEKDCGPLLKYRDSRLAQQWNVVLEKRALIARAIADANELNANINASNWWTLSSIPEIALAVKSTADLVVGVVASVSPGGLVARLATSPGRRATRAEMAERVLAALDRGEQISLLVSDQFAELAWSLVAQSAGQAGAAAETLRTAAEDFERLQTIGSDKQQYRAVLAEQTERLSRELIRLDAQYSGLKDNQDALNAVRDAIDRKCSQSRGALPRTVDVNLPMDRQTPIAPQSRKEPRPAAIVPDLEAVYQICRDSLDPVACVDRELGL